MNSIQKVEESWQFESVIKTRKNACCWICSQ